MFWPLRGQERPKRVQERPKRVQRVSKRGLRGYKRGPRVSKSGPRDAHMGHYIDFYRFLFDFRTDLEPFLVTFKLVLALKYFQLKIFLAFRQEFLLIYVFTANTEMTAISLDLILIFLGTSHAECLVLEVQPRYNNKRLHWRTHRFNSTEQAILKNMLILRSVLGGCQVTSAINNYS